MNHAMNSTALVHFSGFSNPASWALKTAQEFLDTAKSPDRQLISKRGASLTVPRQKWTPRRPKSGNGELWLKLFRGYDGDECMLFPFRTAAQPRGMVTYNFKRMPAHRAMCLMVNKLPPEGKPMALHRCGNGDLGCVTPRHLYWGDQSDNNRDARRHMREGKPTA